MCEWGGGGEGGVHMVNLCTVYKHEVWYAGMRRACSVLQKTQYLSVAG